MSRRKKDTILWDPDLEGGTWDDGDKIIESDPESMWVPGGAELDAKSYPFLTKMWKKVIDQA